MIQETYLITGAATGLGKGMAFGLAEKGKKVIAGVETMSEVSALLKEATEKEIDIQIEKLDITERADRERAWSWDIDVLVNNAAVKEGGSLVDIPEERLRHQFEVNVFGTILLTQGFAKDMVKKQRGTIVFVSSVSGLKSDPFSGPYSGSKFAIEAFSEALNKELQEFNVEVKTLNPGPYLTGFNEREYEAHTFWRDDLEERVFDYEQLDYPNEQDNPQEFIDEAVKVLLGESDLYRNLIPRSMESNIKERQNALWTDKSTEKLGERNELVQQSLDMDKAPSLPKNEQ